MKILELRFKNLNSLYGEWVIDFTDPEYVSNGIFALTGPTGAGKSTILDAICLALYGATPRLGKITKSGNEIMSRQTGECYAEVLFESQDGRFRCHWEQRRARKKAEGNLQDQEHQIANADTGKPIETKKSLVGDVIEEKTGMDFDRFTRSILLAQGGFDTFLKAKIEQKSRILEQITGTEIYSEISRRVHKRQSDEQEKLDRLHDKTDDIVIMEPEQEKNFQQDLKAKQQQEADCKNESIKTDKAITWLRSISGLKDEISNLAKEELKLQSDIKAFQPERDKLDRAIKAASLDGSYAIFKSIQKNQSNDKELLKSVEEPLPELESSAKKYAASLHSAKQQTVKVKEDQKEAAPLIRKILSLDQKLAEQQKDISEDEESCKNDMTNIDKDKQARLEEQEKMTKAKKELELVDGYIKKHAQDKWLISGLGGIEEQLGSLLSKQKKITQTEIDYEKADSVLDQAIEKLDKITKQCGIRRQERVETSKKLQQEKEVLNELMGEQLLREYRTKKETLLREMAYLSKITELEGHRAKLENDKPCPLCGAKEHPFSEGNVPMPDETEEEIKTLTKLISKAEAHEDAIRTFGEAEAAAQKNLTDSNELEVTATNDKKAAERTLAELKNDLRELHADFTELKQAVSAKLQPLGIMKIPDDDVSSPLNSLKYRLDTWQVQVKEKENIEKQISRITSEIRHLDTKIETKSLALVKKQERLKARKNEYTTRSNERENLYGDKNPDAEETRLNKTVSDAEDVEERARTRDTNLQQNLNTTKNQVEFLKNQIDQRVPELEKAETNFSSALESDGFSNKDQFRRARLTTEQRHALSARAKELNDGQTALKSKKQDRETRLTNEIAKKVTDNSLDELEPQLKAHEKSLQELRESIASLKYQLSENKAAKNRIKEKKTHIKAQQEECHRWKKLHVLIGSADGKKYRNFAQGLTFELMVSHANRQLEKMTDRYLLIRDDQQPLELNVVDNYQAGEIRSTKNLSGGESFIVSLALALGLSKMASRRVRVDSLFLDEGFGTLDEEALETALEALSGLQQDGKLIGIISHVSAMKERIGTQITIIPVSGGRSSLAGPGCNKR
jgi:DNA repair protein SbcC/Rad50